MVRSTIACAGSFDLGGILTVASWRMASIKGLSSGWPGTTTGPPSVPLIKACLRVEPQARLLFFRPMT